MKSTSRKAKPTARISNLGLATLIALSAFTCGPGSEPAEAFRVEAELTKSGGDYAIPVRFTVTNDKAVPLEFDEFVSSYDLLCDNMENDGAQYQYGNSKFITLGPDEAHSFVLDLEFFLDRAQFSKRCKTITATFSFVRRDGVAATSNEIRYTVPE